MLPATAVYRFPWEINAREVKEGDSVRTFGRLTCYQLEESRAVLSAQHASVQHQVAVKTLFVEPFDPIVGAQYIVLGEIEEAKEDGVMICARVLNCVDGVNFALLQKAILEQRQFFMERESKKTEVQPCADPT